METKNFSKPPTAPRRKEHIVMPEANSSKCVGTAEHATLNLTDMEKLKRKLVEDDRMDALFRMGQNLTEKFDNRAYLHPHGMTDFDYRSIADDAKPKLEAFKHQTRKDNYRYLSENPEIDAIMSIFLRKVLLTQPADVVHFAAEFFTQETQNLNFLSLLEDEMDRLSRYRVNKMKAAGKINTIQLLDGPGKRSANSDSCKRRAEEKENAEQQKLLKDPSQILQMQEGILNWLKKLNIGPLAQDIDTREKTPPPTATKKKPIVQVKKPVYCGCKDPGRRDKVHPKVQVQKKTAEAAATEL